MEKKLIVILGPTGIGKTDLSIEIAQMLDTEIISGDSRQIYKELEIGTAPPDKKQLEAVKHHLIQNKSVFDYYSAGKYELEVLDIIEEIFKYKKTALLVGGSGMYIDAVCNGIDELPDADSELRESLIERLENEGIESIRFDLKRLDPESYEKIDLHNPKRILKAVEVCLQTGKTYSSLLSAAKKQRNFEIIKIGLQQNREELYENINKRVDKMIDSGLVAEAEKFFTHRQINSLNTVGYKELFPYFAGEYSLERAIELIKRNSRRYAKRQITWFNRHKDINWFDVQNKKDILNFISERVKI